MDFVSIATGVVSILSPYLPQLLSLGKSVGEKIGDAVIKGGVGALDDQAKRLWAKVSNYFKDDPVITSAATVAADAPGDTTRQQFFTEILAQRLKDHPGLADELLEMMGGPKRLQQVIVGHEAIIKLLHQKMAGPGEQNVKAGDKATLEGITQEMNG